MLIQLPQGDLLCVLTAWFWVDHSHGLFVGCLASQQHAGVSQGWICSDNFMLCHTETEVADQTFHLTQSQYTDTGPTNLNHWPTRQSPPRVPCVCVCACVRVCVCLQVHACMYVTEREFVCWLVA